MGLTAFQYGIGVPKGEVARSPQEAEAVAKSIGIWTWLRRTFNGIRLMFGRG